MTPSLLGRWQTRLFLMWSVGALITAAFALITRSVTPFVVLAYVTLFGLGWDVLYQTLQSLRWDRDWPPIFFVFGAVAEAVVLWGLLSILHRWHLFGLNTLPGISGRLTLAHFVTHYSAVWLVTFLMMLGPLRVVLLSWRFHGGRWL